MLEDIMKYFTELFTEYEESISMFKKIFGWIFFVVFGIYAIVLIAAQGWWTLFILAIVAYMAVIITGMWKGGAFR